MPKSKKKSVLIVEDDKFISKAMTFKFEESGFNIKAVRTAEDGLSFLREQKPDAIILDILLPGIDGYAFLREVRGNSEWKKIPVIISSNLNNQDDEGLGESEYIVKSDLDLDQLVAKVHSYIK